jgi:predicted amidohydrolase YtcJ
VGRRLLSIFLLIAGCVFASAASSEPPKPDLILLNGKIFTSDSARPYVQALAIRGDRIVATGKSEQIAVLAGPNTKRIDLNGHLVIPGINDAHYHLRIEPKTIELHFNSLDPPWREVKESIVAAVAKAPKGVFIHGETGTELLFDRHVTRTALDFIAPDNAVVLTTWTQHSAFLNSAALKKLGVADNEPNPVGGHFVRGADGQLTGQVLEYAKFILDRRRSNLTDEEDALQQTRDFLRDALRLGITTVQNMSEPVSPERCVSLFSKAQTPIRVRVIRFLLTNRGGRIATAGFRLPMNASPLVTVSGTKWNLDGTPVERSSALRQPYEDAPESSGEMNFSESEMQAMLRESLQSKDQLIVQITGDRTTEKFLSAMEATGGRGVWASRRVRIEHGDGIMPDLLPRAQRLGVVVAVNPTHTGLRDLFVARYGEERADQTMPFRSLLDARAPLAFGSDGPLNPYVNIQMASTYQGKPREALSREQALFAYTLGSAYAEFAEKEKGSLEPGKLADLAVLSQDIFSVPADALPYTESLLTLVGGKIVFDAKILAIQ